MKFIKSNIVRENAAPVKIARTVNNNSFQLDIWGQPFNGVNNISGDLQSVDNITMTGDINMNSFIIGSDSIQFGGLDSYTFDNKIIAPTAKIDGITSNTGNITTISSDTGNITTINSTDISNSNKIITKDLTVTGQAHFFQLVIDKVKSSGGAAIFSPADGFNVDLVYKFDKDKQLVEDNPYYYRLLWKSENGSGQRDNMWEKNDQALCKTFNVNGTNKYYWSLVDAVGTVVVEDGIIEPETHIYNYIDIYAKNITVNGLPSVDGTVNPEIGDAIAMLGSRSKYPERQSALYISSYNSMDQGITAPFIAQYKGVSDFDLSSHRQSWWSLISNKFTGDFNVVTGDQVMSVQDYINQQITQSSVELKNYKAYAKSETGAEFTLNDKSGDDSYPYVGIAISKKEQAELVAADFVWMLKDTTSSIYKLVPLVEYAYVDGDNMIIINCQYVLVQISGATSVELTELPDGFSFESNIGNPEMKDGIIYLDGRFENTDTNLFIRLLNNGLLVDDRCLQLSMAAGAVFSITDTIRATVTDNTGNISILQQQADRIDLSVQNINNGLTKTGINIEQGKITLNADNTEVTGNLNLKGSFTTGGDDYNLVIDAGKSGDLAVSRIQSYRGLAGALSFYYKSDDEYSGRLRLNDTSTGKTNIIGGSIYADGTVSCNNVENADLTSTRDKTFIIDSDIALAPGCIDGYPAYGQKVGNIQFICNKGTTDPIKINLPASNQVADGDVIKIITGDTSVQIAPYISTAYQTYGKWNIIYCMYINNRWETWWNNNHKSL